jgi:twitching motility protein PilT
MIHPDLDTLLAAATMHAASDLFLQEGRVPYLRIAGNLHPIETEPLSGAIFDAIFEACGAKPDTTDIDSALVGSDGTRFRVSLMRQLGKRAAVLRCIRSDCPELAELGLPAELLQKWIDRKSGLLLVCGPTGSGKSTTVAAMIEWINKNRQRHIITIEDPVEYLFSQSQSIVNQREVGLDVPSFAVGMRQALRQSPDVIFVGEIRDRETAHISLQASETGHFVISTLHVSRAVEAINRLSLLFPESERDLMANVIAGELTGVLCQRLVPLKAGGATVAVEFIENSGSVTKLLRESRTAELADLIANPKTQETRSLSQDLIEKLRAGLITEETALHYAPEPGEITRALRGIR